MTTVLCLLQLRVKKSEQQGQQCVRTWCNYTKTAVVWSKVDTDTQTNPQQISISVLIVVHMSALNWPAQLPVSVSGIQSPLVCAFSPNPAKKGQYHYHITVQICLQPSQAFPVIKCRSFKLFPELDPSALKADFSYCGCVHLNKLPAGLRSIISIQTFRMKNHSKPFYSSRLMSTFSLWI